MMRSSLSALTYQLHGLHVRAAALGILLGLSPTVRAQDAMPAAPAAAPAASSVAPGGAASAVPSPPPAPPAAVAPPPDLSAKVEEADQIARIAARNLELLEERLAARAKEQPSLTADEKGFGIRSADGAYAIKIRGILQVDSRWFLNDDALADRSDTFLLRRFRPAIDGTLFNIADFRFVPDFAGGTAVIFDAAIDIHPVPFARLRVGKLKAPLGLERLQADADLPIVERALTQYLTTNRDIGATLWGDIAGGLVSYTIGIFNGGFDNSNLDTDSNHGKDFAGRILLQPFKAEPLRALGALGLHLGASRGDRRGLPTATLLSSYRTTGLNTFFGYLAPSPDADGSRTVFAYLTQSRLNPGLFYYYGPFGLLGEAVWSRQEVRKGNATATLTNKAAHATATVVIGGKSGYDGATPTRVFDLDKGAWGAVELALRFNWLEVDDATFPDYADITKSASRARGWAGAINYVPSRTLRIDLTYERTTFRGGAGSATAPKDRNKEDVVVGRVQVNF